MNNIIEFNGEKYKKIEPNSDYKLIRTYSAGVWAAYIEERKDDEAILINARRLWRWAGAFSLSELSKYGSKNPKECRFACEVDRLVVRGIIEIIDFTTEAKNNINGISDYDI